MSFIPSEVYPEGQADIWTPPVWSEGPDKLVADAKSQLWADYSSITNGVLSTGDRSISGADVGTKNETDEVLTPNSAGPSRADNWNSDLQDMRRNEPLAAWANGMKDGPANPGA